jgi:Tol biopolymer transport system component
MRHFRFSLKFVSVISICILIQSCGPSKHVGPGRLSYTNGNNLFIENTSGIFEPFPRDDIGNYSWSPDGKMLAFESLGNPDYIDIYIINSGGSGEINLTNNQGIQDFKPNWSPDGKKIVFVSSRNGNNDLYIINSDGTNLVQLTHDMGSINYPDWSLNGKYIIFTTWQDDPNIHDDYYIDGIPKIFRMKTDGSELIKLADEGIIPVWSPDGKYIIYESSKRTNRFGIFRMKIDGSEQISLTNNGSSPSWSPDGKRIAYVKTIDRTNSEIFVMNIDGTNQINLTNTPGFYMKPSWSLDGNKIAFASIRKENDSCPIYDLKSRGIIGIYVMNANGTEQTMITGICKYGIFPNWKP